MLQLGAGTDGETQSIDADSHERISMYIQVLSNPSPELEQLCLVHCREAFSAMLRERLAAEAAESPAADAQPERAASLGLVTSTSSPGAIGRALVGLGLSLMLLRRSDLFF